MKTPEEWIPLVENAIEAILNGAQSYQLGDRRVTRADLPGLINWLNDLKAQAARQSYGTTVPITFKRAY